MKMKRLVTTLMILPCAVALSGCDAVQGKKHEHGPAQIIYSPMGDPLNGGPLGHPTCDAAMKNWFTRADANHDNVVTLDEFTADAKTQFQRMDVDKNGYLVSEELERFRMAYRDATANDKPEAEEHRGRKRGGDEGGHGGNTSSVIDPVMSADANLDFKVSLDEFVSYEQKSFKTMNAANDGKLTLAEVTKALCTGEGHEEH